MTRARCDDTGTPCPDSNPDDPLLPAIRPEPYALIVPRFLLVVAFLAAFVRAAAGIDALPEKTSATSPAKSKGPLMRLLFLGNSFTYYNGGIETHVRLLAQGAKTPLLMEADRITKGGATLKTLQGIPEVHSAIKSGRYDWVILQDDIPEFIEHTLSPLAEEVRRFQNEIQPTGARTALFMAWPYQRLNWVSLEQIEEAHRAVSREHGIPVAPVGSAFRQSLLSQPSLAMLGGDREHETIHGTYLAACVILATVTGINPVGSSYRPAGITPAEAAHLQHIAWTSVQNWNTAR